MRRPSRHLSLAVACGAAAALVLGLTSGATAAPPPADFRPVVPDDAPRTAFEENGGTDWTTLEEEAAFLAEVDAASGVMSLEVAGTTAQGRPLHLVRLQSGEAAPQDRPRLLVTCLQHGNEPAAREACLRYVRDLALGTDSVTRTLLGRSEVLILPTANPDGRAANTRANSDGVDVNRDHLALETAEAQAIARLLRDEQPDSVVDVHEYGGTPGTYDRDLIYLWPRNLNVDDRVYDLARDLNLVHTEASVTGSGFTTGIYGIVNEDPPRQVAGDEDERIFRNMAGLRHVAGQLIESYVGTKPGESAADNRNRRVDSHVAALDGALDFLRSQGRVLAAQTDSAQRRAAAEGANGVGPFYFGGADNDPASPEETLQQPPCAYGLTAEQAAGIAQTLDLHGIATTDAPDGGTVVSMAQSARNVIPLLVDERANHSLVDAAPIAC